jgi:nucleoid-associated protein YgaU
MADGLSFKSGPYPVMFNPTDLSLTKGAQLGEVNVPGLDTPLQQFVRGQTEKLTVKLFFDVTDSGMDRLAHSVTEQTDRFYAFVKIDSELHAPPVCRFTWGARFPGSDLPNDESQRRTTFTGVVESVQQEFTTFSPAGVPLRANLTVTMREYKTLARQLEQLHLASTDKTSRHVVRRGETLASIAAQVYGTPADWRPIADENRVADPRRVRPGTLLSIPALERRPSA